MWERKTKGGKMGYFKNLDIRIKEYLDKKYLKIQCIEDIEINELLKKLEEEKLKKLSVEEIEKVLKKEDTR